MTLTRNDSDAEKTATVHTGFALLSILALAVLVPVWSYIDDVPLRLGIFFACGLLAGSSAMMAWPRGITEIKQDENTGTGATADRSLTWTDLAAAIPDPSIVLDRASVILDYNDAAFALFDRLKTGLPLEHVHRDPELIAAVSAAFDSGERRTARLVASKGIGRRLSATVTPITAAAAEHAGRQPAAVLITIEDQSEQHRLIEMRTDFIANASHELRTPLASVRGFIETLQGPARNDDAARERFLGIMADQAERMTRLIEDLLLLSRVEEKVNLKPTGRVDLTEVIDDVVTSIAKAAEERKIKITVDPATVPLVAAGDRDELFQVFQNLIENAVKYGRDGGDVRVSLVKSIPSRGPATPGSAIVKIADNGPGIAPEHLPRLTERFYRVSAEHSRRIGGTGLGLAIVKHVLNRHAGELHIESVVGTGTTFKVVLPLYKA